MADFAVNINLMGFHGAILRNVKTGTQSKPYIMIPLEDNEISVRSLIREGQEEQQAIVRCHIIHYRDEYIQRAIACRKSRGEKPNPDTLPTHAMTIAHSAKYIQREAQRSDIVSASLQSYHVTDTQKVRNQDVGNRKSILFKAIRRFLNARVGQVYLLRSRNTPYTCNQDISDDDLSDFDEGSYIQ